MGMLWEWELPESEYVDRGGFLRDVLLEIYNRNRKRGRKETRWNRMLCEHARIEREHAMKETLRTQTSTGRGESCPAAQHLLAAMRLTSATSLEALESAEAVELVVAVAALEQPRGVHSDC